jgi:periplasmic protein TonB
MSASILAAVHRDIAGFAPSAVPETPGIYRYPSLSDSRGLPWPAWSAALVIHAFLGVAAMGLLSPTSAPVPLPETVTVVFEPAAAPVAEAPPIVEPPPPAQAAAAPQLEAASPVVEPRPPQEAALPADAIPIPEPALPKPPPPRPVFREATTEQPAAAPAPAAPISPVAPAAQVVATPVPNAPTAAPVQVVAAPVIPPRPVSGVAGNRKPVYPVAARTRHLQGHVLLQVDVSAAGAPLDVRVVGSSGHGMLDEAAADAVRTWRFVPASRGGQPVEASVEVPVDFRMAD